MTAIEVAPEAAETSARADAVTAGLALVAALVAASGHAGLLNSALAGFVAAVVVVLGAIDLRRRVIPNRIVLPATGIVLLARIVVVPGHAGGIVGASALAGGSLLVLNVITRSGIGMGDVKLGLLIGAGLGWGAIGAITLAFFAIFPVAVVVLLRGGLSARKRWLPLGPFLAAGTVTMLILPALAG